ncbi:MAG: hypothetical protein V8Q75_03550 [Bacilli bacterium]
MIELINLNDWKKQSEILMELHREHGINITSREWRMQVKKWNEKWSNGEVNFCITHSNSKGYKATTDFKEAMIAINDFRSRRKNMYKRERDIILGFQAMNMCQLELGDTE